jgi:hypothetical protein
MEKKYDEFINYNWGECEKWRIYFFNLTPTPTDRDKVMYYRKKFYQRNFDSDFDIHYVPGSRGNESNASAQAGGEEVKEEPINNKLGNEKGLYSNFIGAVEAFVWATFFFNLLARINITRIALIGLGIRVLREHGLSFNKTYLNEVIRSDYIHLMLFDCIIMLDDINYLLIFPLSITGLFSICEYFSNHLRILQFLKKYFDYVTEKKEDVVSLRSFAYLVLAIYCPLGLLIGVQKLYFVCVYYLFLRGLYNYSESLHKLCFRLRVIIEDYSSRPTTAPPIRTAIDCIIRLCLFLVN